MDIRNTHATGGSGTTISGTHKGEDFTAHITTTGNLTVELAAFRPQLARAIARAIACEFAGLVGTELTHASTEDTDTGRRWTYVTGTPAVDPAAELRDLRDAAARADLAAAETAESAALAAEVAKAALHKVHYAHPAARAAATAVGSIDSLRHAEEAYGLGAAAFLDSPDSADHPAAVALTAAAAAADDADRFARAADIARQAAGMPADVPPREARAVRRRKFQRSGIVATMRFWWNVESGRQRRATAPAPADLPTLELGAEPAAADISTRELHALRRQEATGAAAQEWVCPECQAPAHRQRPVKLTPIMGKIGLPYWSHAADSSPLCTVISGRNYVPAQPMIRQ